MRMSTRARSKRGRTVSVETSLTLVGLPDHVDDLGGLQRELVGLLGGVLLHTLHLRTVWTPPHTHA